MSLRTFLCPFFALLAFLNVFGLQAQELPGANKGLVNNGAFDEFVRWNDTRGQQINAHDGGILYVAETYYWYGLALRPYGQDKGEKNGAATDRGVNLYSSKDLTNWKYEGVILAASTDTLHPLRAPMRMERPKIIYNAKTKKYVMWFHYVGYPGNHGQDIGLADAGVAVADKITGPFRYLGHQRPIDDSGAVKDCTLFVDDDQSAYFVYDRKLPDGSRCLHLVKLTDDYLKPTQQWTKIAVANRREAPALIKKDGTYYLITSDVSGWKANAAKYFTAQHLFGPWTDRGNPCTGEQKESTYNTQATFALRYPANGHSYIMMLERHNTTNFLDCSYVWLPIVFGQDQSVRIPYQKTWSLSTLAPKAR